jgi:NDP-sugar pyrophosphorylase family protein
MNGDVLTGLDLGGFLDSHCATQTDITVGLREFATQIPYGVVHTEGNRITAIEEKPTIRSACSAGIYALSPSVLSLVPHGTYYDMPTLLQHAIGAGRSVRAHPIDEYWIDVGRLDDLERARLDFEANDER